MTGRAERLAAAFVLLLVLAALTGLPRAAEARSTIGISLSHSEASSESGSKTTESTQDSAKIDLKLITSPSEKISLRGDILLNILLREAGANETTELQPRMSLGLSSRSVTVGLGYRTTYKDTTIVSTLSTSQRHNESYDIYGDLALRVGKLPDMRIRYSNRGTIAEDGSGVKTSDTDSDELRISVSDSIFGVAVNADYIIQNTNDNIGLSEGKLEQLGASASYAFSLGKKLNMNLRHSLSISKSENNSGGATNLEKSSINTSEIKAVLRPITRSSVVLTYRRKVTENDSESPLVSTHDEILDEDYVASASYKFPKYLKFNGRYSMRRLETATRVTKNQIYLGKAVFSHRIKNININANYETRLQQNSSRNLSTGFENKREQTRDRYNIALNYLFSKTFRIILTDSHVETDKDGEVSESTRWRVKLDIGPWHGLKISPYVDLTENINPAGRKNTATDYIVNLSYTKNINQKMDISFNNDYRLSTTENAAGTSESESNNATLRLRFPNILNNMSMGVDTTYSTSTSNGESVSTNSYNYQMTWNNNPHNLGLNLGYQTGSRQFDSYRLSASYGLSLVWQHVFFSLRASYSYNQTMSNPASSSQNMFVTLSVRK